MFSVWPFGDLGGDEKDSKSDAHVGAPFFDPVLYADAPPMPTSLDPNAPRKVPGMGGTKQSPDSIHQANVTKSDATKLLTSKGDLDTRGDKAVQALDLLNGLPPDQRGKVIDSLDDAAFDNLLSRVPPDQRAAYSELVAASKNPERKLRMWKEAHLAKVRNEVNADKADVGVDDLQTEHDRQKLYSDKSWDDQIAEDKAWEKKHQKQLDNTDDDGNPIPDRKRTVAQQANLKEHQREVKRASHTKEEVDFEVDKLFGDKKKTGEMSLEDVDKMIARKEREYTLERKHDLDLSGTIGHGASASSTSVWSEKEMDTIEQTLGELPAGHNAGHDRLAEIWKSNATDVNGRWHDEEKKLEIAAPVFSSPDKVRKKIGDRYAGGVTDPLVSQLELTLTHELGHEYADSHADVYEKFKTAAGWKAVSDEEMAKDNITKDQIKNLEDHRTDPHSNRTHEMGDRKSYSVNQNPSTNEKTPYWSIDQSALPDTSDWEYSHVNPQEHFADVYRTAVQNPAQLYEDFVTEPADHAQKAHARVAARNKELHALADVPENKARIAELRAKLAKDEARAEEADRAVKQRGEQFTIMRNDVFGTNKEASAAEGRLGLRNVDATRMKEFKKRAAELSTPEQIKALEAQYR